MRKTFVILSVLTVVAALCCADAFAGRLGGRRGGCDGGGYGGGYGYYDQGGRYMAGRIYGEQQPMDLRQSFYFDPALQQAARFTIFVPAEDAEVWFDNAPTQARGLQRVFNSPAIQGEGVYTIKARWMENGKPVERERRINVRGGQVHTVDFRAKDPQSPPNPGGERLPNPNDPNKNDPSKIDPNKIKTKELPKELPKPPVPNKDDQLPVSLPNAEQPGKEGGKAPLIKIDGDWTAVYAEMDGQKLENKKLTNVTIKNNVVTCNHDGKVKTYQLEFGPHHMVRCTEQGEAKPNVSTDQRGTHTHHGVYVASQDYLCLSMNKGIDRRGLGAREEAKDQPRPAFGTQGAQGSDMVLILRRAGVSSAESR